MELWSNASPDACTTGKSADYLRRSGQLKDLDFTVARINDINSVFVLRDGEVVMLPSDGLAGIDAPASHFQGRVSERAR